MKSIDLTSVCYRLFSITISISISLLSSGQTPLQDPHWNLVLLDDFDSLNTNVWTIVNNCDHGGEPQVYTSKNVTVDSGLLKISLKNEPYYCPSNSTNSWVCGDCIVNSHNYTSGWIQTKNHFKVRYGYIEAKIKLPIGNGFWPAFWTWTSPNGDYEEIDVFEMVQGRQEYCDHLAFDDFTHNQNFMTTNVHSTSPSCEPHCNCAHSFQVNYISDYTKWHTYAIEWTPSKIIFYLDGKVIRNSQNPNISNYAPIILNLALNPYVTPYYSADFPANMYIDYIKVYELDKSCETQINAMNYDFSHYDNKVKNFIKIGTDGGSNTVNQGDNVHLRASQYVEISGEFTVPVGAAFYMDANNNCLTKLGVKCTKHFNPCSYNFAHYDNTIKKEIELGGQGCNFNITPSDDDILLHATDRITLKPGVNLSSISNKSVELKIVECQ